MDQTALKTRLAEIIFPDVLNDWELAEMADRLVLFPEDVQTNLLHQVEAIWPVSYALCNNFLAKVEIGLSCLLPDQMRDWVKAILDAYEEGGLKQAQLLIDHVEDNFLCRVRGESGIRFPETLTRLEPYATALTGRHMELAVGPQVYTDTATIFLPAEITLFAEQQQNFLLYKLIVSLQWAFIAGKTYLTSCPDDDPLIAEIQARHGLAFHQAGAWLENFCALFPDPPAAKRILHMAELARSMGFLWQELPGLMRESEQVREFLAEAAENSQDDPSSSLSGLCYREILRYHPKTSPAESLLKKAVPALHADLHRLLAPGSSGYDSLRFTAAHFDLLRPSLLTPGIDSLAILGTIRPAEAHGVRMARREENREKFIQALAAHLAQTAGTAEAQEEMQEKSSPSTPPQLEDGQAAALIPHGHNDSETELAPEDAEETVEFITLDDQHIPLPDDLAQLAREITDDLGHVPAQYVSSASQASGKGVAKGAAPASDDGFEATGITVYDEWDYRRAGFRKNWCTLQEKTVLPVKGSFVSSILAKYRGPLLRLRRQFEMMRTQERFVRRQKDGDDIDLDALTESLADTRAGLAPSDRLFIRLAREERSIATLFLVDMSSSTEGWVSTALKEALILMCESLEVLGDTYGIYGFSGMRRSRSELFTVKELSDPYDSEVKGRIAGITPQEYTRMGPPIRHLSKILSKSEAKIRLLITLSDGKPEDYDDYKGDYAIEDTRHALIEAKMAGIHPFCITIDQEAHDYIAHMYGEVNYIFINDVKKLPNRIPEIYRNLTS